MTAEQIAGERTEGCVMSWVALVRGGSLLEDVPAARTEPQRRVRRMTTPTIVVHKAGDRPHETWLASISVLCANATGATCSCPRRRLGGSLYDPHKAGELT